MQKSRRPGRTAARVFLSGATNPDIFVRAGIQSLQKLMEECRMRGRSAGFDQMPSPSRKPWVTGRPCVTIVPAGTLCVSHTFPPMTEPRPMVMRPKRVAPA